MIRFAMKYLLIEDAELIADAVIDGPALEGGQRVEVAPSPGSSALVARRLRGDRSSSANGR